VMRLARSCNAVVLLDGQGADELLAGYPTYLGEHLIDLARGGAWWQAWREYRAFTRRQAQAARSFVDADMRFYALSLSRLLTKGLGRLTRDFLRHEHVSTGRSPLRHARGRLWSRLHADVTSRSLPALLRFADRNSMAFGVEVRNPFLDHRLVEFLMQIPGNLKIRDGWTKFVLREAGRSTLPETVRTRADKVGFLTPEDEWLRGPLRDWAQRILFGRRLAELPGYPAARVSRAWSAHQSRRRNCRQELWPWLSLHEWLVMIKTGAFAQSPVAVAPAIRRAA
jgi:asparagine synthase (glutamine-hydrolysing)